MMAEEHSFEAHKKTEGYLKAKEALLDKMAKWGGLVRKMPGAEDDPARRRAELQQQARELASKRADFEVKIETMPLTDENRIAPNILTGTTDVDRLPQAQIAPQPSDQVVRVERDGDKLVAIPVSEAERVEYLRQMDNSEPEITDEDIPF